MMKTLQKPVFFARCCPKNTVNTVVFATKGKNLRKYCEAPKTLIFTVFFVLKAEGLQKLAKYS